MNIKRLLLVAVAVALWIALVRPAQAAPVPFNPQGAGGTISVDTFDFLPGNSLAVGSTPAIAAWVASGGAVQTPFPTVFQAKLGALTFIDASGNSVDVTPATLNKAGGFEITVVSSFPEVVTGVSVAGNKRNVNFDIAPGAMGINNFIELYYDPGIDANDLAGVGFNDLVPGVFPSPPPAAGGSTAVVDGRSVLILRATVDSGTSEFTATVAPPFPGLTPPPLDLVGPNNYPGQLTLPGTGSTDISSTVTYVNPAFFPNVNPSGINLSFVNTSLIDPFRQVNPSSRFVLGPQFTPAGTLIAPVPPVADGAGLFAGGVNPSLGNPNGTAPGTDFQFQSDANGSFQLESSVPEPSSLILSVVAVGGLGLARLVRRRRTGA